MTIWQDIDSIIGSSSTKLQQWFEACGTGVYTIELIQSQTNIPSIELQSALELMANQHMLKIIIHEHCLNCLQLVSDESKALDSCLHCNDDRPLAVTSRQAFLISKSKTRDISWMLVIHGMNTVGTWQQEFSWLLSNHYKHAVPVFIYKYGNIKIKPLLFISRQRQVKKLAIALRQLQQQAPQGKPDVLAHSYGTLLLSEIIKNTQYQDIKLGRVILLGAIVRPDFDWASALEKKRIDAVLCHHSQKDYTVPLAQFTIPGSGPSGQIGFNDHKNVVHHCESDFGHSSYFQAHNLRIIFPTVWKPFLTDAQPNNQTSHNIRTWRPSLFRLVTHPLKILILLVFLLVLLVSILAIGFGIDDVLKVLGIF